VPTARVIEAVDVLEDGRLSLSAGFPMASPDGNPPESKGLHK